jgi:hypothetical protein
VTGKKICTHVHLIVPKERPSTQTQLVLINEIPYQCSLGVQKSPHRDADFKEVWHRGASDPATSSFAVVSGESLVVNACKMGKGRPLLREDVEDAIDQTFPRRSTPATFASVQLDGTAQGDRGVVLSARPCTRPRP